MGARNAQPLSRLECVTNRPGMNCNQSCRSDSFVEEGRPESRDNLQARSNLDLGAEFDDAVGRQTVETHGRQRRGGEPQIEPSRPTAERRILGGDKRLAADEECGGGNVDGEAKGAGLLEDPGNVGRFEEAMTDDDGEEALAELLDLEPARIVYNRNFLDHHMADDHAFVQHLVMLEAVQQRRGNGVAAWT